jgi:tetratricopeptide (TPR) repeat protein
LEGLPLAIELAAARAGVLTPQQILARLEQPLELLVSRRPHASPRHGSLRAALDWSYQLLPPELQRFFARLSVFRGGWTLEAAEAVCGDGALGAGRWALGTAPPTPDAQRPTPVLEYLEHLRECSLVLAEETDDEMRFRMREAIRQYAREQLGPAVRAALDRQHATGYAEWATALVSQLHGPDEAKALDRLERDHENLRAAFAWAIEAGEAAIGYQLARNLGPFWSIRSYAAEGRDWLTRLLALPQAAARTAERAQTLSWAGGLAHAQEDFTAARSLHAESLAIRREIGDQAGIASSLDNLGTAACSMGDYDAARSLHAESLALHRDLGNRNGIAWSLYNLGSVAQARGDLAAARSLHEESLALRRQLKDPWDMAYSLDNLGGLAQAQDDYAAARAFHQESLALRRALGDRKGIAYSLDNMGGLAHHQGDYRTARSMHEESLALHREIGNLSGMAWALYNLGVNTGLQGDLAAARALHEESLALRRQLGDLWGIAYSLDSLGCLAHDQGDDATARALHEECLALRRELGHGPGIAWSLFHLGSIAFYTGDAARAGTLYHEAWNVAEATGQRWPMAHALKG